MGYSIKRTDSNQSCVVERLRRLGCLVLPIHMVGHGCPDLICGIYHPVSDKPLLLCLIEIKDGEKPPSQRKLTPDEAKFHSDWEGFVYIINSAEEAQELVEKVWSDDFKSLP